MNVQQLIIKGIKEQLFLHNYLVLPGFGGFVLRFSPAHFSGTGTFIVPPSKTVSFNAQLKQNDGLLAVWLQAQLNCSAAEALTHLNEFTSFCTGVLNTRRRLSLDTIGFFYLDFENNICFEPQQDSNFLAKSFGLAPVAIKELPVEVKPAPEPKKEAVFVDRSARTEARPVAEERRVRRNYTRLVVPAALMILFLSGLLLLVSTAKIDGRATAALFSGSHTGSYSPMTYAPLPLGKSINNTAAYVADANGIALITLDNNKILAVKALNNPENSNTLNNSVSTHKTHRSSVGNFEIVLGCFTLRDNANRLVSKLTRQNINAFVSEKSNKGMFVVSNGAFASREEAMQELYKLKSAYPKAWIKKPE